MPNTVSLSDDDIKRIVSILREYRMQTGEDVSDLVETFEEHERRPEHEYTTDLDGVEE
ncbi:hypothetical protein [Haladaptatus sp. DYF46]|uniref:hypothetical protein n=1 Tax=unclassified Haladaptatus TaxID=2622732 RepID=UPI001E388320|nr:hypothetical protein [Haladaptatus sp. DYF46]